MNKTVFQIFKNIVTGWGVVGLQAAIGLFMVPFLLGKLGREGYGVIGIITGIIGFAEIADLGLRQALNRELAEKVALKDKEGFRRLSVSALVLYMGIAVLIGGVGAISSPWLCALFRIGDTHYGLVVLLLRTYAPLTILVSFITPVFTAGICSFMRYDMQNNISMFSQLCISLMLLGCLSLFEFNPLIIWCAVMSVGGVIRLGVMFFFYRKICYGGRLAKRYVHFASLGPLFKLGGSMYVLQLTNMLAQRVDPLIISRFIGPAGVAIYQAGSKLPQMVNPIVLAAVNQLTPLTTKFHVEDNQAREQQVLIFGTKYTLYLGAFFSATMILLADSFCDLWLFDKLGNDVATVALIMKMAAIISLIGYGGGVTWPIVLGKKKMKFTVWLNVPTAICNVILSVYLVGFTKLGVAGVLVGTLISELVRRPLANWYVSWLLGLKLSRFFFQGYALPIAYFGILILLGGFVVSQSDCSSWGGLILSGTFIGFGALISLLIFEWRLIRIYLVRLSR